jgi:hypothetical protein
MQRGNTVPCGKMGQCCVDIDSDQVMGMEDEIINMTESGSKDDKDDPEEIKVLKVCDIMRARYLLFS